MDAVRLIGQSRHALARCRAARDILVEAWQAQVLAQAIGGQLALTGPAELRGEARGLSETGGRGCGVLDVAALWAAGADDAGGPPPDTRPRAAQLSQVADARVALTGLSALLGEVGIALVGVACATDEEALYWQCIEGIDAADESSDRVRGILRRLTVREEDRQRTAARDA
ncbi:hypothetical protein AR457_08420 [Streptomyces agglomeratus]|uniref:Uncharacterized protein n=1 Tax=Streptomyces agglomeratus TaxID=285458 RepID=A0A1E5P4U0_9ACTN|nr:DUF6099 family protein [Streptomyces agglomeratus]OEJ24549.1 hypothetical protein AS594_08660 [Streptomyces agglomeratus]OEJ41499.1 hypothetical protein BGK70_28230 [Streptomyces agglomeratus]OEJ44122.1 hypothetical protein AR457_08420 [Streptomyces agglomeratus]OEJ53989.1 hypothetical protein BGK72_27525 [Streptomyces agglomeratus]OEJ61363.1 hypothetical protein BGM19_28450 [Streptomyces agglomeratus]